MPDPRLGTSQEHAMARDMYKEWRDGKTKSDVELRYLGTSRAHGKRFSLMVKKHLGIDTEKQHPLTVENEAQDTSQSPWNRPGFRSAEHKVGLDNDGSNLLG